MEENETASILLEALGDGGASEPLVLSGRLEPIMF